MKWISNGDPPIYVWKSDTWYNQKDKTLWRANITNQCWDYVQQTEDVIDFYLFIEFPKRTKVMK